MLSCVIMCYHVRIPEWSWMCQQNQLKTSLDGPLRDCRARSSPSVVEVLALWASHFISLSTCQTEALGESWRCLTVKHGETHTGSFRLHCGGCPWLAWKSMEHGLVPFSMDWVWDTTWSTSGPQLPSWQHDPESNVGTCRHSLATGHSVSYDRCDILWHCTKHWEFMKLLLNITKWHWHEPTLLTSTLVHCPNHQTPLPYSATHPRHWWPALVRMTCAQQTEALLISCHAMVKLQLQGIWMYMDVYGCIWMYMDVYGCIWMYVDVCGCIWMCNAY